jgi:transposase
MSSPPLRVFLTKVQDQKLLELSKSTAVSQKTRDRASVIRLSAIGWKVEKIASYFKVSKLVVRNTIHRWQEREFSGLEDAPKPGRRRKWQPEDLAEIERSLETEQRTYSSRQLCQILATSKKIQLSERHLRRILKKKTICGKELESLSNPNRIPSS